MQTKHVFLVENRAKKGGALWGLGRGRQEKNQTSFIWPGWQPVLSNPKTQNPKTLKTLNPKAGNTAYTQHFLAIVLLMFDDRESSMLQSGVCA